MTDRSLLEDFADETREHLEELESSLLRLESDPEDRELLNTIFRSMHTIKGASEYLGFERIARLSHRLENLLDLFREGSLTADKVAVDLLIDSRDRMGDLISQVEASGQESAPIDDLLERIESVSAGSSDGGDAGGSTVYDGEADTELFDIFMEQLAAGLGELMETAKRVARQEDIAAAMTQMGDQVERLAATANYMGYDALGSVYDDMLSGVNGFASQAAEADSDGIDQFLQSTLVGGLARIRELFPNAELLEAIATEELTVITEDKQEESSVADAKSNLELEPEQQNETETVTPQPSASQEVDQSLLADFADETREHLEELESSLLRLESDPEDRELLNTIFRSMHTIKGASEYLGFERIARLSHRLENLLDLFREGSLTADKVAVDLLIDSRDRMGDLISQVEASGQESAPIDDLLERIESVSAGSSDGGDAGGSTVYDGEADTELFDIFMEQLAAGLGELMETAKRVARQEDIAAAMTQMGDQVERLAATANYMGYDALGSVYDDMLSGVNGFASQAAEADSDGIDQFLQSTLVGGLARIRELFPNAELLEAIATEELTVIAEDKQEEPPVTAEAESSELPVEEIPPPADDISDLLAGLPAIEETERESLLSRRLDETFLSMQNGSSDMDDKGGDPDPIALQFSTADDGSDAPATPAEPISDQGSGMSIFDDFGSDPETVDESGVDTAIPEEAPSAKTDADGDVDLWPEAAEAVAPVPDVPEILPEPALPEIDLTAAAPAEEKAAEEPATEENFTARKTIRKSIRVDADKVDDLMNQVGELVVNRSSFAQLFLEMRELSQYLNRRYPMDKTDQRMVSDITARLSDATTVLGRVSGELQEQVMKVRMLPISRLFNRYPRLVHDLLRDSDKKIQLQFRGEETELDRMVIEQLADPMIHIIRNAVDHGIESREDRTRKGKPENGILLLEAFHEGSNVIIEITDDGQGIDLSRIRQKAIEKQLADREALDNMDQKTLIDMIMLPGFSTADQITHTSGRGVGMDVVKRNIEKINGTLDIETRQDVGTRIRIKIPLTLAIIPAMMIRCGGSHFTVPMGAVQETLRIDPGEIFTVDGSEVMDLHEEPLPLVRLTDLLKIKNSKHTAADGRLFVIVVRSTSGRTGFVVDQLLGRQEVVIKPLEDYLQENSGFSGATILGDGGISLILDVDELAVMAKEREAERKLAAAVL